MNSLLRLMIKYNPLVVLPYWCFLLVKQPWRRKFQSLESKCKWQTELETNIEYQTNNSRSSTSSFGEGHPLLGHEGISEKVKLTVLWYYMRNFEIKVKNRTGQTSKFRYISMLIFFVNFISFSKHPVEKQHMVQNGWIRAHTSTGKYNYCYGQPK